MKGQFFPYSDSLKVKNFPIITISLIVACTLVFLWSLSDFENIINTYGFIPLYPTIITIFASMFLHGGFDHLFGNMWYLWIFGDNVEDKLGKAKFIFLYFLSGVCATLLQYLTDTTSTIPAIGASGAISGV
jgi:membrane associated rhomboid family serine protease